jgi:hypothetical protein
MNDAMQIIDQLDNDAIVIEPENSAAALEKWQAARRIAQEQLGKTFSPEWSYITGYLCYMLFSRGACSFAIAERHLVDGQAPGPKQGLAQFYLSSLYFDSGKLASAVQHLERIYKTGRDYFQKLGQEWRYVKSVEMLVATHVRNGAWLEARSIGLQLDIFYHECDDCESMVPLALVGALEKAYSQGAAYEELCRIAARIVRLTHSEHAIKRLFPDFCEKCFRAPNE